MSGVAFFEDAFHLEVGLVGGSYDFVVVEEIEEVLLSRFEGFVFGEGVFVDSFNRLLFTSSM